MSDEKVEDTTQAKAEEPAKKTNTKAKGKDKRTTVKDVRVRKMASGHTIVG